MTSTYVALLRGINVGGKNRLPMPDLAHIFVEAGCGEVRTYIQSGNVVFTANPQLAGAMPAAASARIAERFGLKVPIVLRSAEQMSEIIKNNPFLAAGVPEEALHVLFLGSMPEPGRVDGLDQERSRPDQFNVHGQEVYLCLPNGAGRTKLTNEYFESKLGTTSTGRNWRTVIKLSEMARG